jgi:hypothetical protein
VNSTFDVGLISFNSDGHILIAHVLGKSECKILGLVGATLERLPSKRIVAYLEYHRKEVFLDGDGKQ